jgi:hypothetical protein
MKMNRREQTRRKAACLAWNADRTHQQYAAYRKAGMSHEEADNRVAALMWIERGRCPLFVHDNPFDYFQPSEIRGPKGQKLPPDFASHVYAMWKQGIPLDVSRLLADGYGKRKAATTL